MRRLIPLLLLLGLVACGHKLATCQGYPSAMNQGLWTPTADDLRQP